MMHWKALGTEQKINAIKAAYQPGMSAMAIAAAIGNDVSKGAVIGMFNRYRDELTDCKLNASARAISLLGRARAPRRASAFIPPKPTFIEPPAARIPLDMLKRGMCKFPVNDAAKGETHLFCGSPGEGSWCGFHRQIVYRQPGKDTHE